jgi:hypothetical protein
LPAGDPRFAHIMPPSHALESEINSDFRGFVDTFWMRSSTSALFRICTASCVLLLLLVADRAAAIQIAEWNFDDGTANDLFGGYDLTPIGGGPSISGGIATFDGDEASPSYLETVGYGGNPT